MSINSAPIITNYNNYYGDPHKTNYLEENGNRMRNIRLKLQTSDRDVWRSVIMNNNNPQLTNNLDSYVPSSNNLNHNTPLVNNHGYNAPSMNNYGNNTIPINNLNHYNTYSIPQNVQYNNYSPGFGNYVRNEQRENAWDANVITNNSARINYVSQNSIETKSRKITEKLNIFFNKHNLPQSKQMLTNYNKPYSSRFNKASSNDNSNVRYIKYPNAAIVKNDCYNNVNNDCFYISPSNNYTHCKDKTPSKNINISYNNELLMPTYAINSISPNNVNTPKVGGNFSVQTMNKNTIDRIQNNSNCSITPEIQSLTINSPNSEQSTFRSKIDQCAVMKKNEDTNSISQVKNNMTSEIQLLTANSPDSYQKVTSNVNITSMQLTPGSKINQCSEIKKNQDSNSTVNSQVKKYKDINISYKCVDLNDVVKKKCRIKYTKRRGDKDESPVSAHSEQFYKGPYYPQQEFDFMDLIDELDIEAKDITSMPDNPYQKIDMSISTVAKLASDVFHSRNEEIKECEIVISASDKKKADDILFTNHGFCKSIINFHRSDYQNGLNKNESKRISHNSRNTLFKKDQDKTLSEESYNASIVNSCHERNTGNEINNSKRNHSSINFHEVDDQNTVNNLRSNHISPKSMEKSHKPENHIEGNTDKPNFPKKFCKKNFLKQKEKYQKIIEFEKYNRRKKMSDVNCKTPKRQFSYKKIYHNSKKKKNPGQMFTKKTLKIHRSNCSPNSDPTDVLSLFFMKCQECGKSFEDNFSLNNHKGTCFFRRQKCSGVVIEQTYDCVKCNQKFKDINNFKLHLERHTCEH